MSASTSDPATLKPTLPGFWRFVWMFWMQPIRLHRLLVLCEIEPQESLWSIWRAGGAGEQRRFFLYSTWMLLMGVLLDGVLFVLISYEADTARVWEFRVIVIGALAGLIFSLFGDVQVGLAFAMGNVICGLLLMGLHNGEYPNEAGKFFHAAVLLAVLGILFSTAGSLLFGIVSVAATIIFCTALGVVGGVFYSFFGVNSDGVPVDASGGGVIGVAIGLISCIAFLRLPIYVIELSWWVGSLVVSKLRGRPTPLRFAPVLYHEVSCLPFPWLRKCLLEEAKVREELVVQVLAACESSPGQSGIAREVHAELWSRELLEAARGGRYSEMAELHGVWLPASEAAGESLLTLQEVARCVHAASLAANPYHAFKLLSRAMQRLEEKNWPPFPEKLRTADDQFRAVHLPVVAAVLKTAIQTRREEALVACKDVLPNPFHAGNPLKPDEDGEALLRGRSSLVSQLQNILGDDRHGAAVVLLGPRRTGKTSLLHMLPVLLPDVVPVFFDIQDNAVGSPRAFLEALEKRVQEAVKRDRRLELPSLQVDGGMEALGKWFEQLDASAGDLRILICVDEFERLEQLWPPDAEWELRQLMGIFRATIQHRRRLRLLISGVAPFEELGGLWADHFINAQELRIDYLNEGDTVALLCQPVPEFPANAIPQEVADAIFRRTHGQPNLVQFFGYALVDRLNQAGRKVAVLDDVEPVEQTVLERATTYFSNSYGAPPEYRALMLALAKGERPELTHRQRKWLWRRGFVTESGSWRVPVLGRWILREEGLE